MKGGRKMAGNLKDIVQCIESEGFSVMNWRPGNKRIFKVLDTRGNEVSVGMYSPELRAWFRGYLQGLKIK